jgi:hypothetical protein
LVFSLTDFLFSSSFCFKCIMNLRISISSVKLCRSD